MKDKFKELYAITLSEAIAQLSLSIEESLSKIVKEIREIREISEEIKERSGCIEEVYYEQKTSWPIVWDTRRESQVMSNKPRYFVRKIIQ